ncbi:capsid and scaffold protein [Streptococcus phage CHPC928]|uniref:Capsid and scaffold protein n=1 Tax=Streptococcus phage CHPC928 TaxID=2365049 RepID=A0A3G8F7Y9_9CAUD|nr:capsid and scaffold protein [Streptococcus phage CHPC928]AZF90911.1 capsid and scaffold protein [Streptococcus phage CHPC928]
MQIWIHDRSMRKVCALNNEIPGMLPYTNSQWHLYIEYSTSTFDFTIPKFVNGKLHDDLKHINDQMYVSFYYDNSYHVFYVSQLVENDFSFQVTCNNTNLELAAEIERPLASVDGAKTLEWYLQTLDLLGFAGLEVGFNEISDRTRTITFESQNGTKLEQLHSLMNQFDAEFVFRTDLNRDGTLKKFVIDIYHRPDENHHGIGKVRGDVTLYYQTGLKGVQVTSDKTQLFNAGYFVGKDGLTLESVVFEEKNELGQVEFYSFKDSPMVYAPLSAEKYPSSIGGANEPDRWTRRDFQTEYSDVDSLKAYALRTIKQYAYPLMTYTVSVQSSFIENYKDINLGDTVKIIDNNFIGGLALEARVSEMIISFDNPTNNSVVFTNFRKLDNKPSSELQQRIDEIVSKSLPYKIEIRTTNGTVFKNGIGRSTVKPILKQGDKIVNATYRFVIDGTIKYSGMTYDMVASEINQPTTLTISAWVDNKEVASEEVTFVNVSDGKQGPKGDRGNDGLPGKDGVGLKSTTVTYGMSDSDTIMPTSWTANPPTLIKGKYLWTKTQWTYTDSTSATGYQKTYIAKDGNNGNDGLPGKDGVGIRNTTITYAQGTSGTVAPTNGWSTQVPNVPAGQYLWTKTVWDYTDNTSETGYSVAKMGEQGPKGDRGNDGKTTYFHTAWSYSADGTDRFSTVYPNLNLLVNSSAKTKDGFFKDFDKVENGYGEVTMTGTNTWVARNMWDGFSIKPRDYKPGDKYTMSMDVMITSWNLPAGTHLDEFWIGQRYSHGGGLHSWKRICAIDLPKDPSKMLNQWIKITQTSTIPPYEDPAINTEAIFMTKFTGPSEGSFTIRIRKPKQEPGETATPYMPSASEATTADYPSFIGHYTNYTPVDSPNPRDYTWSLIRGNDGKDGANGGENLIVNSAFPENIDGWGFWDASTPNNNLHIDTHGFYYNGTKPLFRLDNNTNGVVPASTKRFPVKRNTDYSFNIQTFATGDIKGLDIYFLGRKANETDKELTKVIHLKTHTGSPSTTQTVKWHLIFNSGDCDEGFIRINNNGTTDGKTSTLFFAELDCYEGTTDRAWQESSKDLEKQIDTKADDVLTQAQLNRLNETNSIIKAELNAKASLDTLNQWVEAYQNFVNANNANRAQAEKDLADASARVTKLENDLNDMSERWNFIDSYMAASNEGLVVGKKDKSSSIMFNPNGRISMFSAGNEVMYISKGVIHIENGIFSKTIQIGRYREEQDLLNPDRNVIRYVGGA